MAQELNVADLRISSSAFNGHGPIPKRHTGDDDDVSPALEWSGVSDGTKAFALVVHDPDAPLVDGFTHWVDMRDSGRYHRPGRGGADDVVAGSNSLEQARVVGAYEQ
jgi:hypothetical protein